MSRDDPEGYGSGRLDALLTIDEVAAWWKCDRKTVFRLLAAGELRYVRVGRRRRLRRSDLDRYLESTAGSP